jgi:FtsH-binding integral membrane protein
METILEFLKSNSWRLHTFGIAATLGFAFIINRIRRGEDAQLPNRQAAGWVLISVSLLVCLALIIDTARLFGLAGALVSLVLAVLAAGILVLFSGKD